MNYLENNKLIAEFMGLVHIKNAKYKTDLYEAGDNAGEWETTNIFVKNPSAKFLDKKIFGVFTAEDYYNDEVPYEDYHWNVNYDSSWDWLMPVVEKIEKIGVSTEIHYFAGTKKQSFGYNCTFLGYKSDISIFETSNQHDSKIEAVYKTVIEFIKFYNKINKK